MPAIRATVLRIVVTTSILPRMADPTTTSRPAAGIPARELELALTVQRLANEIDRQVTEVLRPHGLTAPQYHVLRLLREAGEDGLACWEIGDRLPTRDPDITRLLDRLERQGLVRRARDVADRRVVLAYIEPAGERALASVDAPLAAAHRQRFRALGRAGTDALQESLEALLGG